MAPVLEAPICIAPSVLLRLLLLGEVALIIGSNLSHMSYVLLVIFGRVFFGILLQDLHDLSPTVTARWSAKLAIIADRSSIDTWL